MASVAFLRSLLLSLASLASVAISLLVRAVAFLLVLTVQYVRVCAFLRASFHCSVSVLRSALEKLFQVGGDALASAASSAVELATRAASWSVDETAAATGEVFDKLWKMAEETAEKWPEVTREMAGKILDDARERLSDAVEYVMENVRGR